MFWQHCWIFFVQSLGRNINVKERKENHSVWILPLDTNTANWIPHRKMFGPTFECPSLNSRQMVKNLTLPKRQFPRELFLWMRYIKFWQSRLTFFHWLSTFFCLNILKETEIFSLFPEEDFFGSCSFRRGVCSIDFLHESIQPKLEKFCSKRENNCKNHIIGSENHFPHLLFCQRRLFVSRAYRLFHAQNPKTTTKTNFFQWHTIISNCWSGGEQVSFDSRSGNLLVGKGRSLFSQFPKTNRFCIHFEKKFTSKCYSVHVQCTIDNPWKSLPKNGKGFT